MFWDTGGCPSSIRALHSAHGSDDGRYVIVFNGEILDHRRHGDGSSIHSNVWLTLNGPGVACRSW